MKPEGPLTAYISARHLSLCWDRSIQSMPPPHPTSWRFILISSSHPLVGLQSGLFASGFPTCMHLFFPPYVLNAPPISFFYWINRIIFGGECSSLISSSRSFLRSPVTSSLLGTNVLLSTLFSNTFNLHFSLSVSNQASHPYKTTGKFFVLHVLIVKANRIIRIYHDALSSECQIFLYVLTL